MHDNDRRELDELERELGPLFETALPPGDPWQQSRMEARAADVPAIHRGRRSRLWLSVVLLTSAGATAAAFLVLLQMLPGAGPAEYKEAPPMAAAQGELDAVSQSKELTSDSDAKGLAALSNEAQTASEANLPWSDGVSWTLQDDYMRVASLSLLATPDAELEAASAEEFYEYLLASDDEEDDEDEELDGDDLFF